MAQFGWPVAYVVLLWWLATGCILYLDGLPKRTFPLSLTVSTLVTAAALVGLARTAGDTTPVGAFAAFTCGLGVWSWMELSFLTGLVTGPRRVGCAVGCGGAKHVRHAIEAVLYHEIAILAGAAAVAAVTWRAPNQIGLLTFALLWLMRTSAKLNLFLGVRNLGESFLPDHLAYLRTFLRHRRMNPLFPVSVTIGLAGVCMLGFRAAASSSSTYQATGSTLLAVLLALAVLEHGFMMLPISSEALWSWGFRSRAAAPGRPTV